MTTKRIIIIVSVFTLLLGAFSAENTFAARTKAKGQGCIPGSVLSADFCVQGLICQIENDINDSSCTDGDCTGVCRDVKDGYGIGAGGGAKSTFGGVGLGQESDLKGVIATIINIILGFLGIVAVIIILFGGFKIMTAAGNEDRSAEGKKAITGGIIGLVIVFASWAIASFVVGNLLTATSP